MTLWNPAYGEFRPKNNNYYSCILVLNITKAGFQHNPRIFFLFCDLDFIDFFDCFRGIHGYFWEQKIENLGWYSWNQTKKNLNFLGTPLGPRTSVRRFAPLSGPRAQRGAREVSIFFVGFHEYHPRFSIFAAKISVNTPETIKKINEIQVAK